jgi:hypothetical protein
MVVVIQISGRGLQQVVWVHFLDAVVVALFLLLVLVVDFGLVINVRISFGLLPPALVGTLLLMSAESAVVEHQTYDRVFILLVFFILFLLVFFVIVILLISTFLLVVLLIVGLAVPRCCLGLFILVIRGARQGLLFFINLGLRVEVVVLFGVRAVTLVVKSRHVGGHVEGEVGVEMGELCAERLWSWGKQRALVSNSADARRAVLKGCYSE